MSTTLNLNAIESAVVDATQPSTTINPGAKWTAIYSGGKKQKLFLKFNQPPTSLKYRSIANVILYSYGYISSSGANYVGVPYEVYESFDAATVTWDTAPSHEQGDLLSNYIVGFNGWNVSDFYKDQCAIKYGVVVVTGRYTGEAQLGTSYDTNVPYLAVTFNDYDNYLYPVGSIQSGYVNPRFDLDLAWSNVQAYASVTTPSQTSAVVTWKEEGGTETTISVTTARNVTIPANTWTSGKTYLWKVSITDSTGATHDTSWYTLTTTAPTAQKPTIVSPTNTIVDGSDSIEFKWSNNTSANNNTGTGLQFSADGSLWTTETLVSAGIESYTLAAGTRPSGSNFWRARSYNADSVAGNWTSAAPFILISAPLVPPYTITNTPRPTITWTSSEQQAFQVKMGDYDSGTIFGTTKTFKCPEYLPNGSALIQVRVMNEYNLWSPWAGEEITISNTPGASCTLSVEAADDANLSWNAVASATEYWVYRNGVKIATTDNTEYIDRWSVGETEYFVRAVLAGDNYSASNTVTANINIDHPMISAIDGSWIHLRYSTEAVYSAQSTASQTVSMMQFSGAVYPVPEISPHKENIYRITVAFKRGESGLFEALLGRECFLKDHYGNAVFGVMSSITKAQNRFYTVCSAELRQIEGTP